MWAKWCKKKENIHDIDISAEKEQEKWNYENNKTLANIKNINFV